MISNKLMSSLLSTILQSSEFFKVSAAVPRAKLTAPKDRVKSFCARTYTRILLHKVNEWKIVSFVLEFCSLKSCYKKNKVIRFCCGLGGAGQSEQFFVRIFC